jgi:hypothetical protein
MDLKESITNALKKHLSHDTIGIIVDFIGNNVIFKRHKSRELKGLGVKIYVPVYKIVVKVPNKVCVINNFERYIHLDNNTNKIVMDIENEARKFIKDLNVFSGIDNNRIYSYKYNDTDFVDIELGPVKESMYKMYEPTKFNWEINY